jgi:hypothetical protein
MGVPLKSEVVLRVYRAAGYLYLVTTPEIGWSRVRVVVVGDVAHVVIDRPGGVNKLFVRDFGENLVEVALDFLGRVRIVRSPDDHRHKTYFAVPDPTCLVFEVALGEDGRLAEFTLPAH